MDRLIRVYGPSCNITGLTGRFSWICFIIFLTVLRLLCSILLIMSSRTTNNECNELKLG